MLPIDYHSRQARGEIELLIPATPRPEYRFLARYFLALAIIVALCVLTAI